VNLFVSVLWTVQCVVIVADSSFGSVYGSGSGCRYGYYRWSYRSLMRRVFSARSRFPSFGVCHGEVTLLSQE